MHPSDVEWIKRNVVLAPLPTPEQRDRLVKLLRPQKRTDKAA